MQEGELKALLAQRERDHEKALEALREKMQRAALQNKLAVGSSFRRARDLTRAGNDGHAEDSRVCAQDLC
jgi:hypothetical protein